jgi:hypothetical protein
MSVPFGYPPPADVGRVPAVPERVEVREGVAVIILTNVWLGTAVAGRRVAVGTHVNVLVGVIVRVLVRVRVGVIVGETLGVVVTEEVFVRVGVNVIVTVEVTVEVKVNVTVDVGVARFGVAEIEPVKIEVRSLLMISSL